MSSDSVFCTSLLFKQVFVLIYYEKTFYFLNYDSLNALWSVSTKKKKTAIHISKKWEKCDNFRLKHSLQSQIREPVSALYA